MNDLLLHKSGFDFDEDQPFRAQDRAREMNRQARGETMMRQNEAPINSSSNRHEASTNSHLRQNVIIDGELVDYEIELNLDELGKGCTGEPFNIAAVYCGKG